LTPIRAMRLPDKIRSALAHAEDVFHHHRDLLAHME
jgi:hypothetical protein